MAACGTLRTFVQPAPESVACARRGRRYRPGAHASAVGPAGRLRCAARYGLAPPNSLRSLRSLRSDIGGESVDEARCARRALHCAARRLRNRPWPVPPAAPQGRWRAGEPPQLRQRPVRAGAGAHGRRREAQGLRPRAYPRASSSNSSPMFERRERSERSEFGDGPQDRASQGSRPKGRTAEDKRQRLPARVFARANLSTRLTAMCRTPPQGPTHRSANRMRCRNA